MMQKKGLKNQTKSNDYCVYCYKDGDYTHKMTFDEMIEINLLYFDEYNKDAKQKMTIDEARIFMKNNFK